MPQVPETEPDEDDPAEPLALHAARCPLRHPERPGEVRVDDLLEPLLGHPHEERVRGDAGVGHQHLDGPLVLLDLVEGAVDGVVVGDVALHAEQSVGHARAAVRDGHLVTVGGQSLGDRQADAAVATGDQHGARYEIRHARQPIVLATVGRNRSAPEAQRAERVGIWPSGASRAGDG